MAADFAWVHVINALRAKMVEHWDIPDSTPIPVAGNQPVEPTRFPMGIIDADGGVPCSVGGDTDALRDVVQGPIALYCWLLRRTEAGVDDTTLLMEKMALFAQDVSEDNTIGGAATDAEVFDFNWTGKGRDWPFEITQGVGVAVGYVGVVVTRVEQ